ncbi:hypothetical protein F5B21DRAFT_357830 [Xylaria acuta]|nr:hypothetical protein F5B21DRAFT_357830 [Xylaria acuta]
MQKSLKYWTSHSHENHSFRLGTISRCLGYIRKGQGLEQQRYTAYLEALSHFKKTVGDKSHYMSQICSSLGAYHTEKNEFEPARLYFNQALLGHRAHSCYQAEIALTLYRQSQAQVGSSGTYGIQHHSERRRTYSLPLLQAMLGVWKSRPNSLNPPCPYQQDEDGSP